MPHAWNNLYAPAKLNLWLHITGKRADGYHLMHSRVAFTEFGDVLHFAPSDSITLQVTGAFAQACGDTAHNLAFKAATLLREALGETQGVAITLEKNIPVGAGLGGGSSDAACVLRHLPAFWGRIAPAVQVDEIARALGADVPMCMMQRQVIAQGIGDELSVSASPLEAHVVLVFPQVPLATRDVYAHFTMEERHIPKETDDAWGELARARNDLQRAAIVLSPEVAHVLLALETAPQQPEIVRMSGSGACCFALCHEKSQADGLASFIRAAYPHWWVQVTQLRA